MITVSRSRPWDNFLVQLLVANMAYQYYIANPTADYGEAIASALDWWSELSNNLPDEFYNT